MGGSPLANFDSELQNRIIRSTQGDGLVALGNQYIPKGALGNPVLGNTTNGYVTLPNNHTNIVKSPSMAFIYANNMVNEGRQKRGR